MPVKLHTNTSVGYENRGPCPIIEHNNLTTLSYYCKKPVPAITTSGVHSFKNLDGEMAVKYYICQQNKYLRQ